VRLTNADPIPGFFLTRRKYDPRSDYFGPYTKLSGIVQTMRTLRLIFPYCQEKFPKKKACSYVGIKQCDGICAGLESKQDYLKKLDQIKNILSGKIEPAENFLTQKMQEAVATQNFELAALWRDRLKMLKETIADQKIILPHPQDLDLVTLVVDEPDGNGLQIGSVFVQTIREGKIINVNNFLLSGSEEESQENSANSFLERFLVSYYSSRTENAPVLVQSFYRQNEI
jgi:excinuclease ABC subunit C